MRQTYSKSGALFLILSLTMLVSCFRFSAGMPNTPYTNWQASNVRILDGADVTEPSLDIIAAYTRNWDGLFQLRVDFLDVGSYAPGLLVAIDNKPGGNTHYSSQNLATISLDIAWDILVRVNRNGDLTVVNENQSEINDARAQIESDSVMDYVIISLGDEIARNGNDAVKIQLFSISPTGSTGDADKTKTFSTDMVAEEKTNLVLCFWNTFQATTPAQALRSWDGAHTGPRSSRHGLRHLIDATRATRQPVILTDLATLTNLSALDYLGVRGDVTLLMQDGLLVTGDVFPGLCSAETRVNNGYAQFHIQTDGTIEPSLDTRRSLISAAFSENQHPLLLGGDFSTSEWGTPGVALSVLGYITNHPWVQTDTKAIANAQLDSLDYPSNATRLHVFQQIAAAPPNPLTEAARHMYSQLATAQTEGTPQLTILLMQIEHLLAGARWAQHPYDLSVCTIDLDANGDPECVLANHTYYLSIEPENGDVVFAFYAESRNIHQLIGPSYQSNAEPTTIGPYPSGTDSSIDTWIVEAIDSNLIRLVSSGRVTMRKQYTLTPDGIQITVSETPNNFSVPIALDPWQRYQSPWRDAYFAEHTISSSWIWGIRSSIRLELFTPNPSFLRYFNASIDTIGLPEDPNRDYTAGHYLPFPMAVFDVQPIDGYIEIVIRPETNP